MADLKILNLRRGQMKTQLTKFNTFLESEAANDTVKVEVRLSKIADLWNRFAEVQESIELLNINEGGDTIDAGIAQKNEEERSAFEDTYMELEARATVKLRAAAANELGSRENQSQSFNRSVNREQHRIDIKLPTLNLPTFNGQYDQWLLFKDSFTSIIHTNRNLSDIQKCQYLRSSLKGEALQVLSSLNTSAENYAIGWELLSKRYENKRLISNTHIKQFLEFPVVSKENTASLRTFIDHIRTHTRALQSLGEPIDQWDTILIYLASSKLDFSTRRDWEIKINQKEPADRPTLNELLDFLSERCSTLEMIDKGKLKQETATTIKKVKSEKRIALAATNTGVCEFCKGDHFIYRCEDFIKLPTAQRKEAVKQRGLCLNCLKKGHLVKDCRSTKCRKCSGTHNILLHYEFGVQASSNQENKPGIKEGTKTVGLCSSCEGNNELNESKQTSKQADLELSTENNDTSRVTYCMRKQTSHVLLSTAQVCVYDAFGNQKKCRVLLDPGSQSNLATADLIKRLQLSTKKESVPITGINQTKTSVYRSAQIKIKSMYNNFNVVLDCLVLPTITERLPQVKIGANFNLPKDLHLADPAYGTPGRIDLLIGAGLFWSLLSVGQIKQGKGQPTLSKTQLGWILGGEIISLPEQTTSQACHLVTKIELQQQLERFWKQEDIVETHYITKQEEACEKYFVDTVERQVDGRFIVRLPKNPEVALGDSKEQALRRLHSLERRMQRHPQLQQDYISFMNEYIEMGHMAVREFDKADETRELYFLPHQAVIRPDHLTTKLRVVFDASAKTSTGASLNDRLLAGPNLQKELLGILIRFRTHEIVLTADIAMMFRQIIVNERDRNLQQILWRTNVHLPVLIFVLHTLTYGTTCAPYLAMRCLKQLAIEGAQDLPAAAESLKRDFYMDDCITGANDIANAIELQKQLDQLLSRGQFTLRKWRSNDSRVLERLAEESKTDDMLILNGENTQKTLGLLWNSKEDTLHYQVQTSQNQKITKRSVLSKIAQVFDPLGLIGPVLINAKIIMQKLWELNLDWDESLPMELHSTWRTYYDSLHKINSISISRNVNPKNKSEKIDLVGFGDASERAYGACLYAISISKEGGATSSLICSKARVAPLRTISLPRLELCAALLLAELVPIVKSACQEKINNIYLWSDSTVALDWIKTPPNQLKTFVANRVAKIQQLTSEATWYHVPSMDNPSDILSRGISPQLLIDKKLWWEGPQWLTKREDWPEQSTNYITDTSERKTKMVMAVSYTPPSVLSKFSSYNKLRKVIALCLRFGNSLRKKGNKGPLHVEELLQAETSIAWMIQREIFSHEIKRLEAESLVKKDSKLIKLDPFLDKQGLIRVGGRLRHADIMEDQKHPIILPDRHHVTALILKYEHDRLLHCGPEQLLSSVRQRYWPIAGRREARKITRSCVRCFHYKPRIPDVKMADLPMSRVREATRAFTVSGVDYAGPFQLRESRRRGKIRISKAYVAVFVCFHTRAVHLELVTDLTSEAFLAALKRFVARRGICSQLHSDNATNFAGAARELREVYEFLAKEEKVIAAVLASQKIEWKFIPPRAPHFGGLWEAAVKAMKRHLLTVSRGLLLTFEEHYTLLVEIEAVLNSRPLTPISSDPKDLSALTPSHFLIGNSLVEPVQQSYLDVPDNHLSRWQHLQKVRQHFWQRWSKEYLQTLQTRSKWFSGKENVEPGTMVLVKDDNLPPLQWVLGRVSETFPGNDGVVRVATIKTSGGEFKRPIKRLCPLPIEI